jgi:regulator of protease activity HflC (stomatin/prohibitin superfamily)
MNTDDLLGRLPPPAVLRRGFARLRGLALGMTALASALACGLVLAWRAPAWLGAAAELRRGGIVAIPLASVLLCLAALTGTILVARARLHAARNPQEHRRVGRAARIPQAVAVPAIALPAAALAWFCRPAADFAGFAHLGFAAGAAAVAVAFLLLVAERTLAAMPAQTLPEAPALRALAFLATCVTFAMGLLAIAANLGLPRAGRIGDALALLLAATGVEISCRALAKLFLPPPSAELARAAGGSLIARLVSAGASAKGGFGAPFRQHLGIDFSRSWALAYVRAASLPMLCALLLLAWGLSGAVLVGIDGRAIYERFGAPVRVLGPGLHLGLPWPLGRARPVDYGTVHEIGLVAGSAGTIERAGAEDAAPPSADRLWDQPHPGEVTLLIASAANGQQSFQSVSADLRILYRVGLTDADAMHAAYATSDPEGFVRASAGRVVAGFFADRTLDDVLGGDRQAMADTLCQRLQAALDAAGSGLQAVAVVIEAVHPPAGAADAYHNVRAAEIGAQTSVAVERGAAATIHAQSLQYAFAQSANAQAAAAETVAGARTASLRFTADRDAAQAGGRSFLLERYFGALSAALGHAPKTIIDHRLNWPEAPVLDLRPFAAAAGTTGGKEE